MYYIWGIGRADVTQSRMLMCEWSRCDECNLYIVMTGVHFFFVYNSFFSSKLFVKNY